MLIIILILNYNANHTSRQPINTKNRYWMSRQLPKCFCRRILVSFLSRRSFVSSKSSSSERPHFRWLCALNLPWHFSAAPWSGAEWICRRRLSPVRSRRPPSNSSRFKGNNLSAAARGGHNAESSPSAQIKREPAEKWRWRMQESHNRHLISHNHLSIVGHLVQQLPNNTSEISPVHFHLIPRLFCPLQHYQDIRLVKAFLVGLY